MSRTYKDRGFQWRYIKNKLYKSMLHMLNDDFTFRKKDRRISRRLRRKINRGETDVED